MTTFISILRGVNVSGQKMVKMDALKTLYKELGFDDVQTYIQSGNVVFRSSSSDRQYLGQKIATGIKTSFGFDVPVIVMDIETLREIVADNPFTSDGAKDSAHLYVTFLASAPVETGTAGFEQYQTQAEELAITNHAVYLYCPNGYGKTKLSNSLIEKKLKTEATTRNWRTTTELLIIAERLAI